MPTLSETSSSSNSSSSDEGECETQKRKNDFVSSNEKNYASANANSCELESNLDATEQEFSGQFHSDERDILHVQKSIEVRKQYRLKYNLLRERCDAIRQDNEQLVSRIWQVQQLCKEGSKHRKYLMDKLDAYGDNYRNIPICVPNETDKDAQLFKEKIANKNINNYPYFHDGDLRENQNSLSKMSNFSLSMTDSISNWNGNAFESGSAWNSILSHGPKKAKKSKKERKEAKSSNPVGRPRKKNKKERKMNVDFGKEPSLVSLDFQEAGASFIHMSDDSEPSQSQSSQGGLVETEGSNVFPTENVGNSSAAERLVMPKRPHNAYFYFCQDHRSSVQKELQKQLGPHVGDKKQVAGILTSQWNELPFERKQAYFKLQEDRKREYLIAMRKYKDSKGSAE